jgi:hypothetical protein
MASTALLPVLIAKTRLRFSWSSSPVANEDPLFLIYHGIQMSKDEIISRLFCAPLPVKV